MPATQSLSEAAKAKLTDAITDATDSDPTILWWDKDGSLEQVVSNAAAALGCEFRAVSETPLELREKAPREKTVWYVQQAKADYADWFKDIEATGNVIADDIGSLAVACFENDQLQAWSLQSAYEDATNKDQVATLLLQQLEEDKGLPALETLQTQIVLDGEENPIKYVLERDADRLPNPDDLEKVRDLLLERDVEAVEGITDPTELVTETRKCAVAEWLIDAGVDEAAFPPKYRPPEQDSVLRNRPELKSLLSKPTTPTHTVARRFLDPGTAYWPDVISELENPLQYSSCVVGGSLEARLWECWEEAYTNGEYEQASTIAETRHSALSKWYDETPWTASWAQAADLSTLAGELAEWHPSAETTDVVSLYGDLEDGTWQIDCEVYKLIVSGDPETQLPTAHPAAGSLGEYRSTILREEYIEYLEDLGGLVEEAFESGEVFTDQDHAHQFFSVEKEHLESGEEVVVFVIDGLRFDLAHVLAEELRGSDDGTFVVDEQPWVGTLPSETSFGKAALTPGNKFNFGIGMDDGQLVPIRNGQVIDNYWRKSLLENDGWTYITKSNGEAGWGDSRVIYYYNDIDELGHENFDDFEQLFADRITKIAEMIRNRLTQGEWETAFVVTDHGFVSLPNGTQQRPKEKPANASTVTRRYAAGEDLGSPSPGIRLDSSSPIRYLQDDTEVELLTDPTAQFSNRGHDDVRFVHGGGLPQEFVLNFLRIDQE